MEVPTGWRCQLDRGANRVEAPNRVVVPCQRGHLLTVHGIMCPYTTEILYNHIPPISYLGS